MRQRHKSFWSLLGFLGLALILIAGSAGLSRAQESYVPKAYYLDLSDSRLTGVSTAAGGVSTLYVHSGNSVQTPSSWEVSSAGGTSVIAVSSLRDGYITYQIASMDASQAQHGKGGNFNATAVTPWFKVSLVDSAEAWKNAVTQYVFASTSGISLAGTSLVQVQLYPGWTGYVQFGIISGVTSLDNYQAKVLLR